ncbi:hypothetical protein ACO9S2_13230 [Nitrospira sp. NS4]|uniref:hypothetical protein n=1 Tax=Nitrospira sp. NS4 TaxID=3414498 RepID=UPI003C2D52B7
MAREISRWWVVCVLSCVVLVFLAGTGVAEESKGILERIGDSAKRVGQKIEEKTKAVVKKVEDKHVGDKIERKLKKAATKTGEGFEKAGRKINEKLNN